MNDRVISKKVLDAFEAVAAQIRGAATSAATDIGALVMKEMQKPAIPDAELDAALQAMPEYRSYREAPRVDANASFEDFAADARRWSDVLQAGLALKEKMYGDWLTAGCPARNDIAVGTPLKLARRKRSPA